MSGTRASIVFASCVLAAWLGYVAGTRSGAHVAALAAPVTAPVAQGSAPAATASIPAAATSFAERFAALAQRAEDGDRESARTLAENLGQCMRLPAYERSIVYAEWFYKSYSTTRAIRTEEKDSPMRKRLEKFREERDTSKALCTGISRKQIKGRSYWLYEAALAGDATSAYEFGSGAFIHDDLLGQLEQIPFWREHSEEMLDRALAGGEKDALMGLARGHDPGLEQDVTEAHYAPDPVAAYAYYTALSLLPGWQRDSADEALTRLEPELSDAEREQALARAADICTTDLHAICDLAGPAPH